MSPALGRCYWRSCRQRAERRFQFLYRWLPRAGDEGHVDANARAYCELHAAEVEALRPWPPLVAITELRGPFRHRPGPKPAGPR